MSRYLSYDTTFNRLKEEWLKYGKIIVAYDVDSTVLPFHEHESQDDYTVIHELIYELNKLNCILIVFTAAEEDRWDGIKEKLKKIDLPYHYFNRSPPGIPGLVEKGKVYANIYLDDRASLYASVELLQKLIADIKNNTIVK
ncbi:MAG: hypothetical protein JNJ40_06045 [Bacteroidia bacterium]|nr:hypothetical protein [Bacteroidia bacterium]